MLAKLIVWAPSRRAAIDRMKRALEDFVLLAVRNNIEFLHRVISSADFIEGRIDTGFLDRHRELFDNTGEIPLEALLVASAVGAADDRPGGPRSASAAASDCIIYRAPCLKFLSSWNVEETCSGVRVVTFDVEERDGFAQSVGQFAHGLLARTSNSSRSIALSGRSFESGIASIEASVVARRLRSPSRAWRTTMVFSQGPNRLGSLNECIPTNPCRNPSAAASSADANSPVTPKAAARAARQYRENSSPIAAPSPCRARSTNF